MNRGSVFFLSMLTMFFLSSRLAPTQSVVHFPPGDTAWTVELTYRPAPDGKAASQPRPVKIEAVRTQNILRYRTQWSDQSVTEDWWTPRYLFLQDRASGQIDIYDNARIADDDMFTPLDQAPFKWVQPGLSSGTKVYNGKSCLYYRKEGASPATEPDQAWVEEKTYLPVALENAAARVLYVYTFGATPSTPLVLPAKCQELIAQHEKAVAPPKVLGGVRQPPPPSP